MTDYALWTDDTLLGSKPGSVMARYGSNSDGWVMPATGTLIADDISALAAGPYNAFEHSGSTDLDVTIENGEAMIHGSPAARDTQTVYTLAASTNNQTLYVGYEPATNAGVVVGKSGDFSSDARKIPIWEFDTQSSSVSSATDLRVIDETIAVKNSRYETSDGNGTAVDLAADANMLGGVGPGTYARLDQTETVSVEWTFGADVQMANNSLQNVNSIESGESNARLNVNAGGSDMALQTGGGGNGIVQVWDNSNTFPIAQFHEGGGVKFPNGDLETRRGWMVDHATPITIEKNGTDGNGVINFKTK